MHKVIDQKHGLDESDREERLVDPMVMALAVIALFLVIGLFIGPIARWLF